MKLNDILTDQFLLTILMYWCNIRPLPKAGHIALLDQEIKKHFKGNWVTPWHIFLKFEMVSHPLLWLCYSQVFSKLSQPFVVSRFIKRYGFTTSITEGVAVK